MTYQAKVIKGGKIVIPAELRRELGFNEGDTLVIAREGNSATLKTYAEVIREVQAKAKKYIKRPFTLDEYLAEKYAAAERE